MRLLRFEDEQTHPIRGTTSIGACAPTSFPDNGREWGGNEDYAEFNYDTIHDWSPRDGTWNDAPFMDNTSTFICEWEYEFN